MSNRDRPIQPSTVQTYYQLTKPGIIYGNCLSATAGFFVAAQRHIDWLLLAVTLGGTALVIAAACVTNNYLDRGIDKKMTRTRQRALVSGIITPRAALIFAAVLGLSGFSILAYFTNVLTIGAGLLGFIVYVVAYGITKRRGPFGTIVGSVAGATPILAGYTAVNGQLDLAAGLLFLAMALWQMPHFYAIAMYRLDDYRSAGIPVLPAVKGMRRTKIQIMTYIAAFAGCVSLLTFLGHTGYVFLLGMLTLSGVWLWKGFIGFQANDDAVWARRMFRFSLLVLLGFSFLLISSPWLP